MKIVGLDLSLTSTGIATDAGTSRFRVPLPSPATERERAQRLRALGRLIDAATRHSDVVVMEGYSFNSENSQAHSIGELGGLVKVCLLQRGVPWISISPSTLKKYATGKGNASKDQVLAAAVRENPAISSNDEADAWWLRQMGLAHYLSRDAVLPEYRRTVLTQIRWPRVQEKEEAIG